jgi:Uri superfamily endonuclease
MVNVHCPDKRSGTYILLLHCAPEQMVAVGRLGRLRLEPGWYAYTGSAFGPGGVAARCKHHRHISERPHWHIDYLRAVTSLRQIWFTHDPQSREHQWSALLEKSRGARQPFAGFGATDCNCDTHLFHFSSPPSFDGFSRRVRRQMKDHSRIMREMVG